MLTLKSALAIASAYVAKKPDGDVAYHTVAIRDGILRGMTATAGCEIPVADVAGVDHAVDAGKLAAMLKAISIPVVSTAKGRKIKVTGGGVSYTLSAVPQSAEPRFPKVPATGWRPVTAAQVAVLGEIGKLVDPTSQNVSFQALRITPTWAAAARPDAVVFGWMAGLVEEGGELSVEPHLFAGLTGEAEMAAHKGKVFVRSKATGEVRWSLQLVGGWPDASLIEVLGQARQGKETSAGLDPNDLRTLCNQAAVVSADRAEPFALQLTGGALTLKGAQGVVAFDASIGVDNLTAPSEPWGARPDRLGLVAAIVAAAGGETSIALGNPFSGLLLWGGEGVVVEALVMPQRLP